MVCVVMWKAAPVISRAALKKNPYKEDIPAFSHAVFGGAEPFGP